MEKAYIILENGMVFSGYYVSEPVYAVGELVFTTGVCGYLETLTDPCNYGQIVVQTFPLIGNYGVIPEDFAGDIMPSGYIVSELCNAPSNFRSRGNLPEYFAQCGFPAVCGADTRKITRVLRDNGVMRALISPTPTPDMAWMRKMKEYEIHGAVKAVSPVEKKIYTAKNALYSVAMLDFGDCGNAVPELNARGCTVTALPYCTPADEVLCGKYDGLLLTNGPGDPAENAECIANLSVVLGKLPVFGVGLGHQIMALASGGRTEKLPYGHRGANQPVRDVDSGKVYVTNQNHGYAVIAQGLSGRARQNLENLNDGSCEGLEYTDKPAFSVQFFPETNGGPQDTSFIYDRFTEMMEVRKNASR